MVCNIVIMLSLFHSVIEATVGVELALIFTVS